MNPTDALIKSALSFDALSEAEELTGQSYKNDPGTEALGFALLVTSGNLKQEMLTSLGDTHFSSDFDEQLAVAIDEGFTVLATIPFAGHSISEKTGKPYVETYLILWHPDGMLLTIESYAETRRNNAKLYFNLSVTDLASANGLRASGGYEQYDKEAGTAIYVGNIDVREAFRYQIRNLRASGTLMPVWYKASFLWLLTYMDTKDADGDDLGYGGYDYNAINRARLALLPPEVQDAIHYETR